MKRLIGLIFLLWVGAAWSWTINANFDKGSPGTKASGTTDGFTDAAGRSTYTNEQTIKGGQGARIEILAGEDGWGQWGGRIMFPQKVYKGETVWFLVHTYMPDGFDYHAYSAGNRLKFMRLHTAEASGNNIGYDDLYFDQKGLPNPFKWIYEGELVWVDVGGAKEFPQYDKWESYEMAVTFDNVPVSKGGQAEIHIWKNAHLIKHITDKITLKYTDAYADAALLFTYWNGGAPKTQHMFVDDITVTNEKPINRDADGYPFVGGALYERRPKPPITN